MCKEWHLTEVTRAGFGGYHCDDDERSLRQIKKARGSSSKFLDTKLSFWDNPGGLSGRKNGYFDPGQAFEIPGTELNMKFIGTSGLLYSLFLWLIHAAALSVTANSIKGIHLSGFGAALAASVVLTVANHFLLPVLTILTLPLTVVTLGFFWLLLYGAMLKLAAAVIPGFIITGWFPAMIGAVFLAVVHGLFRFVFHLFFPQMGA